MWQDSSRRQCFERIDDSFPFNGYRKRQDKLPRSHASILLQVGIVMGFKNPWVLLWVFLGYGSGYRHLYPHKTHTPAVGFKNPWILPWVYIGYGSGLSNHFFPHNTTTNMVLVWVFLCFLWSSRWYLSIEVWFVQFGKVCTYQVREEVWWGHSKGWWKLCRQAQAECNTGKTKQHPSAALQRVKTRLDDYNKIWQS